MAKRMTHVPKQVLERNIALLEKLLRYLIVEPHNFSALHDEFELVILPEDDPDIRLYNLDLLDRIKTQGKPVVFARIKSGRDTWI